MEEHRSLVFGNVDWEIGYAVVRWEGTLSTGMASSEAGHELKVVSSSLMNRWKRRGMREFACA